MTLYDICKKNIDKSADISRYIIGFFTFFIAFMIMHIVMQPNSSVDISEDARIIIMLFSAMFVFQNVLDFVNFIVSVLIGSYVSAVDALRWIKHKWGAL
jgi:hypothetical protein